MNITLFGGSFNPPHLGHQIIINQAFELIPQIDQLWLLPDYQHAFAKNKHLILAHHRLSMTKILASLTSLPVKTETCTFDQHMSGNTITHITYLQKKYPNHTFSFLMGSDNLSKFPQWPKYKTLLKLMPFYIYPRANHPFKPLYSNMHPLKHPLQIITNISSTIIRKRLNHHLPVNHLLPENITQYIVHHHLYQ